MSTEAVAGPCASGFWPRILDHGARSITPGYLDTWFCPIRFAECDETTLRLIVPNESFRQGLMEHYATVLNDVIHSVTNAPLAIHVSVPAPGTSLGPDPGPSADGLPALPVVRASAHQAPSERRPWLVEGFWTPQAVGLIGRPSSTKPALALDMAVSVASCSACPLSGNNAAYSTYAPNHTMCLI